MPRKSKRKETRRKTMGSIPHDYGNREHRDKSCGNPGNSKKQNAPEGAVPKQQGQSTARDANPQLQSKAVPQNIE